MPDTLSAKGRLFLTSVVLVFIICCVLAALANGAPAAVAIGALVGAVAIAGGLITLTHGRLNLQLVEGFLVVLSAIALFSAWRGHSADLHGTKDAGVTPSSISSASPNATYSLTVTKAAPRKFLSLTVQLRQLDVNDPACVGDILLSASVNGLTVALRLGVPTNVPVGPGVSAHQFTFQLNLADSNQNATCSVDVSVKGTLQD